MRMLMLPLNHQLQLIPLMVMMLLPMSIIDHILLHILDRVLLGLPDRKPRFAQLPRVRPEDVLFFFRYPAFYQEELRVLFPGGEVSMLMSFLFVVSFLERNGDGEGEDLLLCRFRSQFRRRAMSQLISVFWTFSYMLVSGPQVGSDR